MKPKVLLVDDEPMLLRAIIRMLGQRFDLVSCDGGDAGLKLLADDADFAVVVTDLRMPVMDGAAFLKQARKVAPRTAQIMLTGTLSFHDAISDQRGLIFRCLEKPCPAAVLAQAIEEAALSVGPR